jgi:SAM-dependent methyltransferase
MGESPEPTGRRRVQQPTPEQGEIRAQLLDLLAGFVRTQAVAVVAKLGVADAVTTAPMDVEEIARRVGADAPSLYRLLRFLATIGVFAEVEPRRFAATPLSDGLRTDASVSARWHAIMFGSEHYRCWAESMHSFLTGEPSFACAFGEPYFDYLAGHPDESANFDRAMAAATPGRVTPLTAYDWSGVGRVADVGGGTGTALAAVLAAHPHLHGVLFDRPDVVAGAEDVLRAAAVVDRCEVVGGDFFNDALPAADAYVLSRILHDWSDEAAAAILRNCRRTLADGGRLLLVEGVVPDDTEPAWLKLFDLHMLVLLGGKERTAEEWRGLLAGEGFELREVTPGGLLEARPA